MTRYEEIVNSDIEQLAEFLWEHNAIDCSDYCEEYASGCALTCKHQLGKEYILQWLEEEI